MAKFPISSQISATTLPGLDDSQNVVMGHKLGPWRGSMWQRRVVGWNLSHSQVDDNFLPRRPGRGGNIITFWDSMMHVVPWFVMEISYGYVVGDFGDLQPSFFLQNFLLLVIWLHGARLHSWSNDLGSGPKTDGIGRRFGNCFKFTAKPQHQGSTDFCSQHWNTLEHPRKPQRETIQCIWCRFRCETRGHSASPTGLQPKFYWFWWF